MAIAKQVTFEGEEFFLDNRDRVAAFVGGDGHPEQYHYMTGHGMKSAGTGDSLKEFTQPANTVITDIWIHCVTAPTMSSGDLGFEVGTSSSGAQIVATSSDTILDGGTTVAAGKVKKLGIVNDDAMAASDLSASNLASSSARTIYLNITNTAAVSGTDVGSFTWIIKTLTIGESGSTHGNVTVTAL